MFFCTHYRNGIFPSNYVTKDTISSSEPISTIPEAAEPALDTDAPVDNQPIDAPPIDSQPIDTQPKDAPPFAAAVNDTDFVPTSPPVQVSIY